MIKMLGAGLFNDPLAIILIVAGFVLIAVALILYFLVFRKKIKSKIEKSSAVRAEKKKKDDDAKNFASGVFKSGQKSDEAEKTQEDAGKTIQSMQQMSAPKDSGKKKGGAKKWVI